MAEEAGEPKKYFSVPEAEGLIPELTRLMGGVMDAHGEAQRVRAELSEEQRRITMSGGALVAVGVWRERARRLGALTREVQEGLATVVELGGVPKDLATGLVDFPFLLEGEEVNLCWRFGEKKIRFWHGLDEGFAGRKPIPEELT